MMDQPFLRLVANSLKDERFNLVDVGCSGGIEAVWRLFGDRFAAIGFDASQSEVRRLQAEETSKNVHYVAGFVGIPPDHPFARRAAGKPTHVDNVFGRTSAAWALELRAERLAKASDRERMQHNVWGETELAEASQPVFVAETLERYGFDSVDFLKIDIDGPDFHVLNSLDGLFEKLGILGVRLEVCLFGGADETNNTFHNTDRFMRRQGYDLVELESRNYSNRALPARFAITMPAQAVSGRVVQAEAFYVRDLAAPHRDDLAARTSAEKIAKLAAIFSVWEQPDGAAELLVKFRDRLSALFDVDRALDMLAAQTQLAEGKDEVEILSYRDYLAFFATDPPDFYPAPPAPPPPPPPAPPPPPPAPPKPTLRQRLKAAHEAWYDWHYVDQLEAKRRREAELEEKRKARAARDGKA